MKKKNAIKANIELELKLEEINVQKKIQRLSKKEFIMKKKCENFLIVNQKLYCIYLFFIYAWLF